MSKNLKVGLFTLITIVYFSSVASAALQQGLIGYWNFDEGTGDVAADASGNGNDLTREYAGNWAPTDAARIGNSAYHNSSGRSGFFGTEDVGFINGLSAFSLCLWVKSNVPRTDRGFIVGRVPNFQDENFSFRYDKNGYSGGEDDVIKAGITTTEGTHSLESSGNVQTLEWQHLVFTWTSGEQMKIYIDGVLDTPFHIGTAVSGVISNVSKFSIGRGPRSTSGYAWRGSIDDVRLYNRPLTQAEIRTLASGATTDGPFSAYGVRLAGVGRLTTEMLSGSGNAVYTVRITNTGSVLDTFNLTTAGDVNATLSRTSVSLAPGASTDVIMTIRENTLADAGEYEVRVTATSQGDSTQTATITTNTTIFVCGVELTGVGDLTTKTADASAGVNYTIRVKNTGSRSDTVTLTTSGDVEATLSKTSVTLAGGASTNVTLTINGDALSASGEYEVKVKATSGTDSTKTAEVTTQTTILQGYGVTLVGVGDLATKTADASAGVSYTIRVKNTGNTADTITLTTSGDVEATLSKTSVTLAGGASTNVTLTINGDALSASGEYEVKVKATSGTDSTKTAEVTTQTTILQGYGVTLVGVGDLATKTADASAGVSYTIRVKNTGNTADTITLTTSEGVEATLSESSISLDAGASSDVTLTIDADALTTAGTYKVKVTATSKGDSTKTAEILTETTIPLVFDVELTSDADLTTETTDAGSQLSWTIRVTNTGNSGTAVLLAASGGVDVVFSQTVVPLKQNASTDVTITIAEDALAIMLTTPGDVEINVTATLAFSTTILDEITSTITIEQMPWDLNKDGTVNILDLVKVANDFGQSGDGHPADVNGNRNVNILDLVQVASNFGETQVDYALANLTVSHD